MAFALAYLGGNGAYIGTGGTDEDGNPYFYANLNWREKLKMSLGYAAGGLFNIFLTNIFLENLVRLIRHCKPNFDPLGLGHAFNRNRLHTMPSVASEARAGQAASTMEQGAQADQKDGGRQPKVGVTFYSVVDGEVSRLSVFLVLSLRYILFFIRWTVDTLRFVPPTKNKTNPFPIIVIKSFFKSISC